LVKKIAILGDFNPIYKTHHALNDSTRQVKKFFGSEIQFDWIATDIFDFKSAFNKIYCGLWLAPGTPYKNDENVISTIKYARENSILTFGNCGGFQYMIIEFARNVCGIDNANHEESHPDSKNLVVSKLSCSLIEKQENLEIIDNDSIIYRNVKKEKFVGRYYCNYGINPKFINLLSSNGLNFTAKSDDGQMRSFEIKSHPFFVATLFQPALTSTENEPNPIILEFVKKCLEK